MHVRWRQAAGCAITMVSILLITTGWGYETGGGTPTASGTPAGTPLAQAAFPVRAGDLVIVDEVHVILQPEPAYSADRVAMLPQRQVMEATGRTVIRDGERWLELRYPVTGDVGWVSDRWLTPLPPATPGPDSSRGLTSPVP